MEKKDVDGGGRRGILRRRLRLALARSGEGFFAEQRCQSNFISPFLSKAFFRSFVEPQAIFCREESPAAWWQRMREKSMLSSPLLYNQLHRYTIHTDLELKIQIRNIFASICLNWKTSFLNPKLHCSVGTKSVSTVWKTTPCHHMLIYPIWIWS